MSPTARNTSIYSIIAIFALFLASRFVTVALMLKHAPEDAEPFFYLKQVTFSVICVGLILLLWGKRIRRPIETAAQSRRRGKF